MWYYVCLILILQSIKCDEITTIKNDTNEFDLKNKTHQEHQNHTIEMQRITQPVAQSLQIERAVNSNSTLEKSESKSDFKDFRPSPHLETYYEYNKVPVPPALPEAKHFPHHHNLNYGEFSAWPETTEQPWTTRVKFPNPTPINTQVTQERPYQFYQEDKESTGKSYNVRLKTELATANKPQHEKLPTVDDWNKFIGNYHKREPPTISSKNQFDFAATVPSAPKPVYGVNGGSPITHKTNLDFGALEKSPIHELQAQGNPWKKIIKFLTAFIPIGLLISALTPTVITVSSVNGTQSRSRAEKASDKPTHKVISTLNYFNKLNEEGCESRILCELLLSATATNNAEHHIENILNTFTEDGKAVERAEEMKRIFKAVRNQNCQPITCPNVKENT